MKTQPNVDLNGLVEMKMTKNGCWRGMVTIESVRVVEVLHITKALVICHKYYSYFMFTPLQNGSIQNVRNVLNKKVD